MDLIGFNGFLNLLFLVLLLAAEDVGMVAIDNSFGISVGRVVTQILVA